MSRNEWDVIKENKICGVINGICCNILCFVYFFFAVSSYYYYLMEIVKQKKKKQKIKKNILDYLVSPLKYGFLFGDIDLLSFEIKMV